MLLLLLVVLLFFVVVGCFAVIDSYVITVINVNTIHKVCTNEAMKILKHKHKTGNVFRFFS